MTTEPRPKRSRKSTSVAIAMLSNERTRLIQYCKMAIQIYTPLIEDDTTLRGRIEGYRDVLRQMGETE